MIVQRHGFKTASLTQINQSLGTLLPCRMIIAIARWCMLKRN
jgi:hypothetical protein